MRPRAPPLEAQQHIAIIIERASFDHGAQIGKNSRDLQSRHELRQMKRVYPDVADASRAVDSAVARLEEARSHRGKNPAPDPGSLVLSFE